MNLETFKSNGFETKIHTVCFFVEGNNILLAMKKRGFGEGKWNGYGGKIEAGETIEEAMLREALEESSATITSYSKVGLIDFYFPDHGQNLDHKVHAYLVDGWSGKIQETEEMRPQWFKKDHLPTSKMWPADTLWIPMVLNGQKLEAEFLYDDGPTKVLESIIKDVKNVN